MAFASSALAAVLAEFARVGSPEKVGHVVKLNINIYIKYSINRTSTPALAMQLFPPQTTHYLPLLLLLPLQLASASLPHLVLLAFSLLLRPNTTQNYCNAAASLLVSPLILLLNFYDASLLIYSYAK